MSYITKGDALNFLQTETNAYIDAGFATWLSAIETFIEKFTGKEFEQVVADTRYFDGNGKRVLLMEDDLISVTSLKVLNLDGTTLTSLTEGDSSDYRLYPYNTTPKYEIRLTSSASVGAFYSGSKRIEIIGTFGNSASVPADIKMAAIIMVGAIIKAGKGKSDGDIKSTQLGDYKVDYQAVSGDMKSIAQESGAMAILSNYREWEI